MTKMGWRRRKKRHLELLPPPPVPACEGSELPAARDAHPSNGAVRRVRGYVQEAIDGSWYYEVVAGNGETLFTSETYTRRQSARRGLERFIARTGADIDVDIG